MRQALVFFLLICSTFTQAQGVKGTVVNAQSKQPVEFATVYFANTTIGVASAGDGSFSLMGIEAGKYDLTVSFVGYKTITYPIEIVPGVIQNLRIELEPDVVTLPEIFVTGDRSDWMEHYETFKRFFIGSLRGASDCNILNEDHLYFYYNPETRVLLAYADEPIQVENKWLGYRLYFDLQSFTFDFGKSRLSYYGIPRFEQMEAKRNSQMKRWENRRHEAYSGSVQHFFRSLHANAFDEEGYTVNRLHRIPNPMRLPDSVLNPQMDQVRAMLNEPNHSTDIMDSLQNQMRFLRAEYRKSEFVVVLGEAYPTGEGLMDSAQYVPEGLYRVDYKGRKRYVSSYGDPKFPESELELLAPVKVYSNGYYEDVRNTYLEGDWSRFETIATMLPIDYLPPQDTE